VTVRILVAFDPGRVTVMLGFAAVKLKSASTITVTAVAEEPR
jgi:hypothetical protein